MQSGYDSRERRNYLRITASHRLSGTNTGLKGRWAFHVNNVDRTTGRPPIGTIALTLLKSLFS